MENFKIAQSDMNDTAEAVKNIREQLSDIDACMVLYFASPSYPVAIISKEMADAFPGIHTVGCTASGEMITGKMGQDSIVAMAWPKASLKFLKIEVLEDIQNNMNVVAKAFQSFEESLGKPMSQLDPAQYAGMIMIDGLSGCEEKLNDQLGNLTNVPFVGGSASDNFIFQNTWLFVDGKAYTNAAILLLMEPANGYAILKTQSFTTTSKKLTPTQVDEKRRMVIRFDGKPATEAFAGVLGISVDELKNTLVEYPLGLVFDEHNFFVRSPMKIEGTSIIFYCSVKEGLELTVLRSDDIVTATRTDLQKCGKLQAIVDFNCCLRTSELSRNNQLKEYSEIFGIVPAIGFATYGESYIGHINQTSTMLLIK
jgi:hypothetical protein